MRRDETEAAWQWVDAIHDGWRAMYEPRALGRHVRFFSPSTRGSVPAEHRRLQFRNRLLMIAKNDRPADVLRDLPHLLLYSAAAIPVFYGFGLLFRPGTHWAIAEFWRWWVIHLWVGGIFEVFTLVVTATLPPARKSDVSTSTTILAHPTPAASRSAPAAARAASSASDGYCRMIVCVW